MMMSNRYRDDRSGEVETRIRERLFDTGIAGCRGMLADCEEDFDAFLEMYRSRVTARGSHRERDENSSSSFERKYTINFSIPVLQGASQHYHRSSRDDIFEDALRFYTDMRLKQSNQKLRSLMSSRTALPIAKHREQILAALESSRIVLIAGDTGCGKSTQVPQYLLEADRDSSIICTQPRRLAAMSLCRRVQTEQLQAWGSRVAYQMRFDNTRTRHTRILFVTEGLLLRLLESDGELSDFNVLLLDEVHERHAPMDVILSYIPELLQKRNDLKIILMSATFDTEHFRDLFNLPESAVISVCGRSYPVTTEYIQLSGEPPPQAAANMHRAPARGRRRRGDDGTDSTREAVLDCSPYLALLKKIQTTTPKSQSGDALVFLSGAQEIECLCNAIRDEPEISRTWIPLPLHAQLPVEEQDKAFDIAPRGMRKCVIATNVAETSITIDGIRFVIDSGKVKEMSVDAGSSTRRLAEQWISQASADQRKGRAGRTGPGQCYRMYSEKLGQHMLAYTRPEITRNFDSLVHSLLQLLALDVDVSGEDFRFPTDIQEDSMRLARNYLCLARAATKDSNSTALHLTSTGRVLSRLPVPIPVGNMLLMSMILGSTAMRVATIIAASLNFHSPFRYGEYSGDESADLLSDSGDLFTCFNVYTAWLKRRVQSREGARRWARERGIDESKMYDMSKSAQQLQGQLREGRGGRAAATDMQKRMQTDAMALLEGRHEGKGSEEESAANIDPLADKNRQRLRSELAKLKAQQLHRGRKILDVDMITGGKEELEKFSGVQEDSDDDVASDDSCGGRRRFTGHQPSRKSRKLRASDVGERSLRLRQLDIEFDLRLAYGGSIGGDRLFGTADKVSTSKMKLLSMCIGKALYPNISYPAKSNRTEGTAKDCLFTVLAGNLAADRFASIHPQSVLYPIANEISPETECVGFSSLLLTYRPFIVHCIRLPLLSTLLFAAANVNTNTQCDSLVIDQRLYLTTRGSIEKLLGTAIVVRQWLESRMDLEISALFEAFDWGVWELAETDKTLPDHQPSAEGSPRLPAELSRARGECHRHTVDMEELQSRMLQLQDLAAAVEFDWQIISEGDAAILAPSQRGERVTSWLTWGNVDDTRIDISSGQVSDSLKVDWRCPDCGFKGRLNRKEISDHKRRFCNGMSLYDGDGPVVAVGNSSEDLTDEVKYDAKCEDCSLDLSKMDTIEILEHKRSHGRV